MSNRGSHQAVPAPGSHPQNRITNLTRRKLLGVFHTTSWSGDLEEVDFLKRLYDLGRLPSTDDRFEDAEGDIIQHRVNNYDWDDAWVFTDDRFALNGGDEALLRFLAETVHPDVRGDADSVTRIVRELNIHLSRDGWELSAIGNLSGYPVFGPRARSRATPDAPPGFPIEPEALVASIAEVLKARGNARELAILANSRLAFVQTGRDNWNGGTDCWGMICALPATLHARLTSDEREQCEITLREVASEFFRKFDQDCLNSVMISPAADVRDNWRSAANEWLSGKGINNQGRVRSDNIASLAVDGLLFRSEPEINLYRAFKKLGVTFAPLPVFLRGGATYARLEPDFVILKDGIVMVVEVDGDTYHYETPAEAHERSKPMDHEGAKIERVRAQECDTDEKANQCARNLLQVIERMKARR